MIAELLPQARAELRIKTKADIDTETAAMWGARAVAAWEVHVASGDIRFRDMAVEFAAEAGEHAASGVEGTLERICTELRAYGVP